jgi:hypothetical protein
MVAKQAQNRSLNGKNYREAQRQNSDRRKTLHKADQKWLKQQSFKNVGWDNVIQLHIQIEKFLEQYRLEDSVEDSTLEDLFLEADRIGNKYLTQAEIYDFNQQLAQEISEIEAEIDRQFPDTEMEVIDFRSSAGRKSRNSVKKPQR